MWFLGKRGFLSIVVHHSDPDTLVVRGREQKHLEAFCTALSPRIPFTDIEDTPECDYPFRVLCSRAQVAEFLTNEVSQLDYPNFKGAVDKVARDIRKDLDPKSKRAGAAGYTIAAAERYAACLHRVWAVVRMGIDCRVFSAEEAERDAY